MIQEPSETCWLRRLLRESGRAAVIWRPSDLQKVLADNHCSPEVLAGCIGPHLTAIRNRGIKLRIQNATLIPN
jgi:hypothetical protein